MKRYLSIIIISCFFAKSVGQDLKSLEKELKWTLITDLDEIRNKANKIYLIDPFNETATLYLVKAYNYTHLLDSISLLFKKLKSIDPKSPLPYILSARLQFMDRSAADTSDLEDLKTAIELDSNNFDAHLQSGITYYKLFNQKQTNYHALQSRKHLIKATQIKPPSLDYLKYAIIQMSEYLNDKDQVLKYEKITLNPDSETLNSKGNNILYYPIDPFLEINSKWKSDYSINIMELVLNTNSKLNCYSQHLAALEEPLLYNHEEVNAYRLLWLRSFHGPVAIRIENKNNTYRLFWKQLSQPGCGESEDLIHNSSKIITEDQWDKFISLLKSAKFWSMAPSSAFDLTSDGSHWIIEGVEKSKYYVVNRRNPDGTNFQKCGLYLIGLTDLKIESDELY